MIVIHKLKRVLIGMIVVTVTGTVAGQEDLMSWPAGTSPQDIGKRVADRFVGSPHQNFGRSTPPSRITYPEVCTWYGALTFAKASGDTELKKQLIERFEPLFNEEKAMIPNADHVDHTVFVAVPLELYIQTKDPRYLTPGQDMADKQWSEPFGSRATDEAWEWYRRGLTWQTRLWIDDMFMITAAQAQAYRATGDRKYIDRAAREMVVYLDELQQPNGLFYHAPDVPFFWGRGDGWMAAGVSELLRALPMNHPDRPRIMQGYQAMMASLLKYQDADGMWHQLIDDPNAWPETSCTGMFTFAFITGVKEGWLDEPTYGPAARKGWLGLIQYIDENADIREVCQGTNKRNDRQYYLDRQRNIGDMHGQAPVLWCATALLRDRMTPVQSTTGRMSIRSFGAVGDGKTLDSPAINLAIAACARSGGGTVVVPAGTYLCGSIRMKSNVHLYLDAGSIILGAPQDMNAYDPAEPFEGKAYQDGGHTYFHNSLIWGENLENISITGSGMINGGGLTAGDGPLDRISGFSNRDRTLDPNTPVRLGNKAIAFKLCRQVLMRNFIIYHGGHFAIITTGCDGLTIDNVTIDTNRDGIDLDCCRNTTVSNCRINSPRDDALCPKSSFALGRNVITENLTIVNCQVSGFEEGALLDGTMKPRRNPTGRIKFGTEANGGFRNVTVSNCTFRNCRGLALEEVDGGILENITINNITMMEVSSYPIYITTGKRNRGPDVTTVSRMRNVIISNVIATGVSRNSGIQITGMPEHPIEGLRLENIWLEFEGGGMREDAARVPPELDTGYPEPRNIGVMPAYGLFARHVRNLELGDIRFSFAQEDLRPAMVCVDVDGLEIDNFKAQLTPDITPARFEQVTDLVIRNSPILESVSATN